MIIDSLLHGLKIMDSSSHEQLQQVLNFQVPSIDIPIKFRLPIGSGCFW